MLIVKNLCKTYHSKGGVSVKALDDVSITFPETGMVFLLGKSGSGKSTLLNVCGGLDTPDSGEIIVRGRSSKTFSGSDFDSYRNTFVGFIFQEYNVLNEFTVEENLSLALELQGKRKNKKQVNELLKQVDLEGFARRKPQTLSGGQKQRIAIARALIKDPKIIMADEPTGALDSNTGKQVLDTLNKLSRTRLVVIVSHDREFAEIYGDRIIELKDGKIISDVSKEKVAAKKIGGNIAAIGKHTISVKKGTQLTDSELNWIRDFISKTDSDVLITNGAKDIEGFRKSSRIADDNSSERFSDTETEKIAVRTYSKEEGKLVRSRLPMGRAIKMGASSLKVKPFRLFFTILLAAAAFILFGVFSTLMTYNKTDVLVNSFMDSDYTSVRLKKNFIVTEIAYLNGKEKSRSEYSWNTGFTEAEVTELGQKYGGNVLGVYAFNGGNVGNITPNGDTPKTLTDQSIMGYAYAEEGSSYRTMVAGTYPVADDEVAVSEWYATMMAANTVYSVDGLQNKVDIGQPEDIVGKYLNISDSWGGSMQSYKITGVFKGDPIPSAYDGYTDKNADIQGNENLLIKYNEFLSDSSARVMLVGETFAQSYIARTDWKYSSDYSSFQREKYFTYGRGFYTDPSNGGAYYQEDCWQVFDADSEDMLPVHFLDGKERKTLAENEIVVSPNVFVQLYRSGLSAQDYEQKMIEWENGSTVSSYKNKAKDAAENGQDDLSAFYTQIADNTTSIPQWIQNFTLSSEWKREALDVFSDFIDFLNPDLSFTLLSNEGDTFSATLVGFYDLISSEEDVNYGTYVSSGWYSTVFDDKDWTYVKYTKYVESKDVLFKSVFVPFADKSANDVRAVISQADVTGEDDSCYSLDNSLYTAVDRVDYFLSFLSTVFFYVGLGLAAFAAILLFNFISVSISNKTHEIGVLRAVGARGSDVFKIFFAESAIITLICFVISIIASIVLVGFLNRVIAEMMGMASYTLLVFGGVSFAMMLGVAVAVALLGTFFPVFRISRRKPVDSMRSV